MQRGGKQIWIPRLDFNGAHRETLRLLKRIQENHLAGAEQPELVCSYLTDRAWSLMGMEPISRYLRFSTDRHPDADQVRGRVARLLAVALKGHFFMAEDGIVVHEPYVFTMPDLARSGTLRAGLLYPLERGGKQYSLLAADWNIGLASSTRPGFVSQGGTLLARFPAVLRRNSYTWLGVAHWRELRKEAEKAPWLNVSPFDADTHGQTWGTLFKRLGEATDVKDFPFGTVLEYSRDLNQDVVAAGGMWARGIKHWFLPYGYDAQAVREWLDMLAQATPAQRYQMRWWEMLKAPVANTESKPRSA